VLPLALGALLATSVATWVGVRVTTSAMRARLDLQLLNSAAAVSSNSFALNSNILANLRAVAGADVVTLGPGGEVVASAVGEGRSGVIEAARRARSGRPDVAGRGQVAEEDCGFHCIVAFQRVSGQPGMHVFLVADASPLDDATRAVVRTMSLAAAGSVLFLVLVGQLVVRRVTAPLDRLVAFVRSLDGAGQQARAVVGDDEIGQLAEAFNGMLDRLDRSKAALVRSEKLGLAGLFAARVAHDVRNPLSSVRMQTQLLQSKHAADSDDREVLAGMVRDIDQVESVVKDLMELANPGELRVASCSLNAVLESSVRQVAHQLTYRRITVEMRLDDGLPDLPLDAGRLKQAFLNLLVNASEAMPSGGRLEITSGHDADGRIWCRICDDGVGVDPRLLERVFDPFVSTKPEGVGLGLVNVKAVVEAHGGRISLGGNSPRGTCAELSFPGPVRG
jgi:signal transduction histidine kinase